MTQRTFLTSAVLTVATGQIFCQPDLAFGLIHSMTGTTALDDLELAVALPCCRAALVRQHPWIADLDVPDLHEAEDPRLTRWSFLAAVCAEHGGTLPVEVRREVEDIPVLHAPHALPHRLRYVRLGGAA